MHEVSRLDRQYQRHFGEVLLRFVVVLARISVLPEGWCSERLQRELRMAVILWPIPH